ncbi:MAG: serine hydrolase [Chloroflexi bacterium]|nr:serine hydrolase [Chloroflexota bacterium]
MERCNKAKRSICNKDLTLIIGIVILTAACGEVAPSPTLAIASSTQPQTSESSELISAWPTEGWQISTPEEQGMDSELLADMLAEIEAQDYPIDIVLVIRNGKMVLEVNKFPFRLGNEHNIFSCTKSVVSALIGIAIDQGYIESVDTPILDFFPDITPANLDVEKQAMTLEHVLTMTTGLECCDSYLYNWRGLNQMMASDVWIQHVLDLPMVAEPGKYFEYCNGASTLLSEIIQQTTGMTALDYAQENLFGPLGISNVTWSANLQGITYGFSELFITPRAMAKIGYLFLMEGQWEDQQILPPEWIEASSQAYISATIENSYGYQWWVDSDELYMALGYSGQFIFVMPNLEMVVIFTSHLQEEDFYRPQILLTNFIIPAAESSTALQANAESFARLEALTDSLTNP